VGYLIAVPTRIIERGIRTRGQFVLATTAASYLDALNPEQRRAVEHGVAVDGHVGTPLLVIAGAGSGKTNTLAHRVAHLIVRGADPRRILLMTFSRRAASEMSKRVERIARKVLGEQAGIMNEALSWAGTFHGIGARLLREYAEQIGLNPAFTIHDREDSADLMNLVRHERGLSKTESRFPARGTCLSIYSRCVNAETELEEVLGASYPWYAGWAAELKELFAAYVEAKQKHNVLDYDDLLLYWAQMMSDPAIADDIGGRFDHVLVDEYQDTNRLQSSVLLALKPAGRGLTVVGDDAQSIYSFRAATVRNILDFPEQFSPKAEIVTLDRNYRSTQPILSAANGVIDLAQERFTKNLWTERASSAKPRLVAVRDEADQARYIVERILESREEGALLKQQAVLFRTSSHSGPLEIELTRRNIPFVKFGGLKFLDARTSRTCLRCYASWRTRAIVWPASASCTCCPASVPRPRNVSSITWQRRPTRSMRFARCPPHPARATTGPPSSRQPQTSDIRSGHRIWNVPASGTNRTSTASTRTPTLDAPILSSLSKLLAAIHRANAS
jgi:DNA helicase-2/ATP-dependent DNA helicase PcrA